MSVQDLIFATGGLVLTLALIPSVRGVHKPEISSSLIAAICLTIYTGTYFTFHPALFFSAATAAMNASCWWILAWQRWRQEAKRKELSYGQELHFKTLDQTAMKRAVFDALDLKDE